MKQFLKWLKLALNRLAAIKDSLDRQPWPTPPQDAFEDAGAIAAELGKRAAELGLSDLVAEAAELEGAVEPDAVRVLVARAIAACSNTGDVLTEPQAAAFLSICPRKLWELGKSGQIPRVPIGTAVRYRRADLEMWLAAQ